ncbi:uncharacterized protein LOC107646271 [Arachis ipaensis]|uniref:uncharacterized protein LOC107646271 n=1 Tax=Arachis ipaensis TaxID=130454 RepID=UPI000A2B39F5|nr:uncharacterized protein LOC107646271 [Arachis ipaensis]
MNPFDACLESISSWFPSLLGRDYSVLFASEQIFPYNVPMRESSLWLHRLNGGLTATAQQQRRQLGSPTTPMCPSIFIELIPNDSAARKHVYSFDQTWVTHLYQKVTFFQEEARQRQSSILPESERPAVYSSVKSCALDHDAECVTEILVRGICRIPNLQQIYVDLLLSEYNPFKIVKDGKLVAYPWDMPPPYPTNSAILSSSASAYDPSKCGPLAEYLVKSWMPQYRGSKRKTCHVETGPSDVTEQFLLGYCRSHNFLLQEVCQPLCLNLLSEVSPVKIKDGNLVANATLEAPRLALENMSLQPVGVATGRVFALPEPALLLPAGTLNPNPPYKLKNEIKYNTYTTTNIFKTLN